MPKEKSPITTKHDALFRKALENPLVAKEFFDINLPGYIKELVDTSTLKLEKESFVEEDLRYSLSDVLFSVKFKKDSKKADVEGVDSNDSGNIASDSENNDDGNAAVGGYIYLLTEHQSKPDPLMAFRLFKYMVNICDRHLTTQQKEKKIPLIYPMIFYQGKQKYNAARNIFDMSISPELAKRFWLEDYQLIDLQNIPDDELKKHDWYGSMAFLMKHIFERDLIKIWEELSRKLPILAKVNIGEDYIKLLLTYTLTKISTDDKVKIQDLLTKKLGEQEGDKLMISAAQELYDQGIQEGITKGKIEGKAEGKAEGIEEGLKKSAANMLKQGLSIELIKQVTGLGDEELLKIKSSQ